MNQNSQNQSKCLESEEQFLKLLQEIDQSIEEGDRKIDTSGESLNLKGNSIINRELIDKLISKVGQTIENLSEMSQSEQFVIPDFSQIKDDQERINIKNNIEHRQKEFIEFLMDLNINKKFNGIQDYLNTIQNISDLILKMENAANTIDILKINKYLTLLSNTGDLQDFFLQDWVEKMSKYYELQLLQYIKFTTQKYQDCDHLRYNPPQYSKETHILVAREVLSKGYLKKGFDLIFTLGNMRYKEYYYVIIKRDNGSFFVEERIYINEKNGALSEDIEVFDNREQIKAQLSTISTIAMLLQFYSIHTVDQNSQIYQILINKLEEILGQQITESIKRSLLYYHSIIQNNNQSLVVIVALMLFQLVKNTQEGKQKFTNKETPQKGFLSYVFKRLIDKSVLSVIIMFPTIIQILTLVFLILVIGTLKSFFNTHWEQQTTYICELYSHQLNFEIFQNLDLYLQKVKTKQSNFIQNLMEEIKQNFIIHFNDLE